MRRALAIRLACGAIVCGAIAGGVTWARRRANQVTFTEHIAPLVFQKCAPCHRPGEAGPFNLLTYEDVADHASQIVVVTGSRFMPPWKPVPGYAEYANDRSLSAAQIELFRRWVEGGAKQGDPDKMPPTPEWPKGWQLGEPDVVFELPEPYTVAADGPDVYRNFVIRSPVDKTRFVKAWEFRSGARTIHHAILNLDVFGRARQLDDADPAPGFGGMDESQLQAADGFYLVWTPGMVPTPPVKGAAWRLDRGADLVLQLHMQPTGKAETIRPKIGLFFSDEPPTRVRFLLRVGDPPIDIPPGEKNHVVRDAYVLPASVNVVAVFPHAHLLAKRIKCWATLPDGSVRGLLRIDDWDFFWQDKYTFREPIPLPEGTKVSMEISYDNSAENPRNPTRPPKRVMFGEQSTDEMGNVALEVEPRDSKLVNRLREDKYRGMLAHEDIARHHYNLANALADLGKTPEAIQHFKRAIELDPKLHQARFNLVLLHVNLGNAKKAENLDEAIQHYRDGLAVDPASSLAHNSLALALLEKKDAAAAIEHFKAALAVEPDNALSHYYFANALRSRGQKDDALVHYRRALELRPGWADAQAAIDALGKSP